VASDESAGRLLSDYMRSGWIRHLPRNAFTIYDAVLWLHVDEISGEIEEQPVVSRAGALLGQIGGLEAGIWDEQEADLLCNPDPEGEALLKDAKARLARAEAAFGLTVRTNADLIELMRRLGVIERMEEEGEVRWRSADPLPLPGERLPLSPEEAAEEDELRWERIHYDNAQSIIRLFVDEDLDVLSTTLADLAQRLELPVESVREAILVLLGEGDFTASVDVERIDARRPLELRVDWDRFADTRIGISVADVD
jgi:hypothetical protein